MALNLSDDGPSIGKAWARAEYTVTTRLPSLCLMALKEEGSAFCNCGERNVFESSCGLIPEGDVLVKQRTFGFLAFF